MSEVIYKLSLIIVSTSEMQGSSSTLPVLLPLSLVNIPICVVYFASSLSYEVSGLDLLREHHWRYHFSDIHTAILVSDASFIWRLAFFEDA